MLSIDIAWQIFLLTAFLRCFFFLLFSAAIFLFLSDLIIFGMLRFETNFLLKCLVSNDEEELKLDREKFALQRHQSRFALYLCTRNGSISAMADLWCKKILYCFLRCFFPSSLVWKWQEEKFFFFHLTPPPLSSTIPIDLFVKQFICWNSVWIWRW